MTAARKTRRKGRRPGRPRGRATVPFALRLWPEQKRDLETLSGLLDGGPSLNGLIQTAVALYLETKLEDHQIRAPFNARTKPRLEVIG